MATASPQRSYTAACSFCGAPVEFRSAASAFAVCSYCRSTLVRDGDTLRRIGESAELFDDHTPLQLGAAGRYLGEAFTLVGRLQYGYAEGTWNEWHALFDSGRSGWLSEDNGRYVFAFDDPLAGEVPQTEDLHAGDKRLVDGRVWDVASVVRARLVAAQGELPRPPKLQGEFIVSDLRNAQGEVGTLDYTDPAKPAWSVGRSVALGELAMSGLKQDGEKTLKARGIECPSCGTALQVKLESTKSIVCDQCHAVVDVSQGVGGDLQHYAQEQGKVEPLIPLGSTGSFSFGRKDALPWQVVGYVERCEVPDDPEDEQVFWREYLLYNRTEGFAFIVDAEDGWSWVRTLTGVPQSAGGDSVKYEGAAYRKLYSYTGKITYVLGEFYWRLQRGERTFNTDYQGTGPRSDRRLNREQTGSEVTWSGGSSLTADAVRSAFSLPPEKMAALRRDATPLGAGTVGSSLARPGLWLVGLIVVVLLMAMLSRCGRNDCDEMRATFGESSNEYRQCLNSGGSGGYYRSGGGSFGGFSSGGGGHK